jgi:hypothetical protein
MPCDDGKTGEKPWVRELGNAPALVKSLGFRLVATTYGADIFKCVVGDEHRFEIVVVGAEA